MPRLTLSLPAELGSTRGTAASETREMHSPLSTGIFAGGDGTDKGERPQIDAWLACWSGGRHSEDE